MEVCEEVIRQPGLIASIEVAEAVKVITGQGQVIRNGFIHIDTLNNDYELISFE